MLSSYHGNKTNHTFAANVWFIIITYTLGLYLTSVFRYIVTLFFLDRNKKMLEIQPSTNIAHSL